MRKACITCAAKPEAHYVLSLAWQRKEHANNFAAKPQALAHLLFGRLLSFFLCGMCKCLRMAVRDHGIKSESKGVSVLMGLSAGNFFCFFDLVRLLFLHFPFCYSPFPAPFLSLTSVGLSLFLSCLFCYY